MKDWEIMKPNWRGRRRRDWVRLRNLPSLQLQACNFQCYSLSSPFLFLRPPSLLLMLPFFFDVSALKNSRDFLDSFCYENIFWFLGLLKVHKLWHWLSKHYRLELWTSFLKDKRFGRVVLQWNLMYTIVCSHVLLRVKAMKFNLEWHELHLGMYIIIHSLIIIFIYFLQIINN